jgi:hypothetical protein
MNHQEVKILTERDVTDSYDAMASRMETKIKKYLSEGWTLQGGLALAMRPSYVVVMSQLLIKTTDNASEISDPTKC